MRASELVANLSEFLGERREDVRAVDRCLAATNMRPKGHGITAPEVASRIGSAFFLASWAPETSLALTATWPTSKRSCWCPNPPQAVELPGVSPSELAGMPLLAVLEKVAVAAAAFYDASGPELFLEVEQGGVVELKVGEGSLSGSFIFSGAVDPQPKKRLHRACTADRQVLAWFGRRLAAVAEAVDA